MNRTAYFTQGEDKCKIVLARNQLNKIEVVKGYGVYFGEEEINSKGDKGVRGKVQAQMVTDDLNERFRRIFNVENVLRIQAVERQFKKLTGFSALGSPQYTDDFVEETHYAIVPTDNYYKIKSENISAHEKIRPDLIRYMNILSYSLLYPFGCSVFFSNEVTNSNNGGGKTCINGTRRIWLAWELHKVKDLGSMDYGAPCTISGIFLHEFLYHYTNMGYYEKKLPAVNGYKGSQRMRYIFKARPAKNHDPMGIGHRPQIPIPDAYLKYDSTIINWNKRMTWTIR